MHKIPRLINLLKGNISLVGPRPIAKSEVSRVKQRTASGAFTLTPGVTGFTRIANRKNTISVLEESLLDTKYLQSRSFLTDTGIIFKTVFTFKKRTRKAPILAPLTVHVRPPASQTGVLYIPRNRYANFLGAKA
jgi:O-antigen biosynthesis protein WbqP